jgi:uncharacterized protein YidB (DUF937 family)
MSLVNDLLDGVLKQSGGGTEAALLQGVMGLVGGNSSLGGLGGLMGLLESKGLGDQVKSWVGTGQNQAVSGDQIQQALGDEHVQTIAQQAGCSPEEASAGIAQILPHVVDQATPDGKLPDASAPDLEDMLGSIAGKLLGR